MHTKYESFCNKLRSVGINPEYAAIIFAFFAAIALFAVNDRLLQAKSFEAGVLPSTFMYVIRSIGRVAGKVAGLTAIGLLLVSITEGITAIVLHHDNVTQLGSRPVLYGSTLKVLSLYGAALCFLASTALLETYAPLTDGLTAAYLEALLAHGIGYILICAGACILIGTAVAIMYDFHTAAESE